MKLWLNSPSVTFVDVAEIAKRPRHGSLSFHAYLGRTGIVMLRNFWGPHHQGDHIDLWNGEELAHGELNYFSRSEEVWFWELR
jgi:hypothetical protein